MTTLHERALILAREIERAGGWSAKDTLILLGDNDLAPRVIAEVSDDWDQDRHAALIAAAPKLLRALAVMLDRKLKMYAQTPAGLEAFQTDQAEALAAIASALNEKAPTHD